MKLSLYNLNFKLKFIKLRKAHSYMIIVIGPFIGILSQHSKLLDKIKRADTKWVTLLESIFKMKISEIRRNGPDYSNTLCKI